MKTKTRLLMAVVPALALFLVNAEARADFTTTYSDGLTTGVWNGPNSATVATAATVVAVQACEAVGGGYCYQAVIDKAFAFSYAATILLPEVGKTFDGGFIDQTFHNSTKVHEDWHDKYARALYAVTYVKLEDWSKTYKSNLASSEAAALALGMADLENALKTAKDAFMADFSTDTTNPAFGHQNAVAVIESINGVDTWRSKNPDWGQAAVTYANGIKVEFTKGAGDCTCVPEPTSFALLSFGVIGGTALRRVRKGRKVA